MKYLLGDHVQYTVVVTRTIVLNKVNNTNSFRTPNHLPLKFVHVYLNIDILGWFVWLMLIF